MNEEHTIREILNLKTIAVVGISANPARPSNRVAAYLKASGYTIIPVNPGLTEVLDLPCYPDLAAVPEPVDVVDVFRQPEFVPAIVEAAIAKGVRAVWLQDGVINETAAKRAETAGLLVVMNDCMLRQHSARSR